MYKGINIKNSSKPIFLQNNGLNLEYRIEQQTQKSISPAKDFKVKIKNLPSNINLEAFYNLNIPFLYHDTIIFSPVEMEEKRVDSIDQLPYYEFYDRFNYNSTQYNLFSSNLSELELPNFYLSKRNTENDRYSDLFSFDFDITSNINFKNSYSLQNSYNQRTENNIRQMKNIFLAKDAERYGEAEKSYFPYAVDIKLNFKDIDITSDLLDRYQIHKSSLSIIDSLPKENVSFNVISKNFDAESRERVADIPVSDVKDLLDFAYFPRDGGLVYLPDTLERSRYTENLDKLQARREYNKFAADNIPNIIDILSGKPVKNEILYVKMQKYSGEIASGEVIQNIWLRDASIINQDDPSKSKFGIYDYYDTQVKIGKTYTYVIKAYVLIYGGEVTCLSVNNSIGEFRITPSFKITEVELARKTITVLPPIQLPPLVHVHNDLIDNKVLFYLQLEQGRRFMDYILFTERDEIYRKKIYDTSQYKKPEHAFMLDKGVFEVFRIDHMPNSLEDFSNFKIAQISRDGISTSAVFSQNIAFDKEYYYLFRSLNFLEYPSNPSKIYKIILKKGIEKNHLELETFDIKPEEEKYDIEKKFTKLIHIMPNIRDTFINENATESLNSYEENINKVKMGLDTNFSSWGKRYKIRIKSNNTGKKIDLNVTFKLTKEQ